MDPTDTNEVSQEFGENAQGEELSHSDKMIGIFTEPAKTFEHTAKFALRAKDWVIPVLILFLVAGLVSRLAMMNDEVYFEIKQKQAEAFEKQVEDGSITREQADQQMEGVEAFMRGPIGWITTVVGSLIVGFIMFFIIVAWYWLWSKFILKGEGSYSSALVANGLTAYISTIQIIITGILTFLFGTLVKDTSLAALLSTDQTTIAGFFLAKINPLSLWAYIVLSIGLAKMFKSKSTGKYYALVFGSWIIVGLILFYLSKNLPFLENLT
jgi:hypothetical protein